MKRSFSSLTHSLHAMSFLALGAMALGSTGCVSTDEFVPDADASEDKIAETSQALRDKLRRASLATGFEHSLVRTKDGRVLAWGNQTDGRLGNGLTSGTGFAQYVKTGQTGNPELRDVVAVAAGYRFSMALTADGKVYTWGYDGEGQLGNGTGGTSAYANAVPNLSNIVAIAAGQYHSMALAADGTVWTWGRCTTALVNGSTIEVEGLGYMCSAHQQTPAQVPSFQGAVAIASGSVSSYALKADGTVWSWGTNSSGRLGDNTTTSRMAPVQAVLNAQPTQALTGIVAIRAGEAHVAALSNEGAVFTWGFNGSGQLGIGNRTTKTSAVQVVGVGGTGVLSDIADIAVGRHHVVALRGNGSVVSFGINSNGELGTSATIGSPADAITPQEVSTLSSITALGTSGGSWAKHSLALRADGQVLAWGRNNMGQVGVAGPTDKGLPLQVTLPLTVGASVAESGDQHSLLLKADGTVWAWGSDVEGQLGNGAGGSSAAPAQVLGISNAADVSAGAKHSLALLANGTVMAWGSNTHGQLGVAGSTQQQAVQTGLPSNVYATAIAASVNSSYALASTGAIYSWGGNDFGQLGNGTVTGGPTPTLVLLPSGSTAMAVGGGEQFGAALAKDGRVLAWGNQVYGRVGNGASTGKALSPVFVQAVDPVSGAFGDLQGIVSIAIGGFHSLALDRDGRVWAWGYNNSGQIGDGTSGNGTDKVRAVRLASPTQVVAIAAGRLHSYAVTASGAVYGWGANADCQLSGTVAATVATPTQIGQIEANNDAVSVTAGNFYGVVTLADGKVYAFGDNTNGQLGPTGSAGTDSCTPLFVTQ